jgi:hypothetical protein
MKWPLKIECWRKDYSFKGCPIRARANIIRTISSICSSYDFLLVIKDPVSRSRHNLAACLSFYSDG